MQALHFSYGVGNSISPLITAAVLSNTNGDVGPSFWANAAVIAPLILFPLALPSPKDSAATLEQIKSNRLLLKEATCYIKFREPILVCTIGLSLFMAVGAEAGFGGWLSTYTILQDNKTDVFGSLITSAYWGAFTFGRFLGIFISKKLSSKSIILIDIILGLFSLIVIIFSKNNEIALWIGTIFYGLAVSTLFASAISLPPALDIPVSGQATSWFVVGSAGGETTITYVIGYCLSYYPPIIMMWILFASWWCALFILLLLVIIAKLEHPKIHEKTYSGYISLGI